MTVVRRKLALDLGTTTGWATHQLISGISSGSQSFAPSRFEGGGMRFLRFVQWLDSMYHLTQFEQVAFEEVRQHAGTSAAHIYGGFLAHLTSWCERMQIPYEGVPVGTIKKHATGKGNASKKEMITAMIRKGHATLSADADDEADALAILHWMIDNETARNAASGPAPYRESKRRLPLDPVQMARLRGRA